MFCEHAAAAKSNSALYQPKDHDFAFLADHRYVFHFDDEFTAVQVCSFALSQALLSSAAHGAMSFPSTTNRRCLALSINEIFSIASSNPQ
jgi:hypothetical protein